MTQHDIYKMGPKKLEFIYKKLCIFSYIFKLLSPSKHSPFDVIHLSRHFSTAENSCWTHWFWYLLVLLPFFCFTSSISAKHFPLRIFSSRETEKELLGVWSYEQRGCRMGVMSFFGKKFLCLYITHHKIGKHVEKIHWNWMMPLPLMAAGTLIQMGS